MANMEIKKMVLGMVGTNCYIVSNKETNEAIIIDPADNSDRLLQYLKDLNLELKGILLTHGHFDHILGLRGIVERVNVPVYCEESEKELLKDTYTNLSEVMGGGPYAFEDAITVKDGELLNLASFQIKVLHTPGHTKGGACYLFENEKCMFSGDTLFFESVGRTDFPTGNHYELIKSICDKIYIYEDNIIVYPGHGPETSIGYEKENNPFTSQGL